MLVDGLWLMVVGMATVFLFLGLLVGALHLSAWALKGWPEDAPPPDPSPAPDDTEQARLLAVAIAAARRARHAETAQA